MKLTYDSFFFYFIYLWLCWVFIAACGLSLVESGGCSLVVVSRLLPLVASLVAEHRLSSCCMGSSQSKDGARVCCVDRWILTRWTAREADL